MPCVNGWATYGGIFDYADKKERLEEVDAELARGEIWAEDPDAAQALGQEKARLTEVVTPLEQGLATLDDSAELFELAEAEDDAAVLAAIEQDIEQLDRAVEKLEFRRMFSGEVDENNAFVDIQAG